MDSVPSASLGSHLLSLPLSLFPSQSARAKLHLGALQPLCLSGWFTLHWPGLGLPGPHYQLPATGTHCSWQTQGRGTQKHTQKFLQWKKGMRRSGISTAPAPSPGPNAIHAFRRTDRKTFIFTKDHFLCIQVLNVWCPNARKSIQPGLRPLNHHPHLRFFQRFKHIRCCTFWWLLSPFGETTEPIRANQCSIRLDGIKDWDIVFFFLS